MKKILVINCGSSSLKYEVYSMPGKQSIGKGLIERIGQEQGHIHQKNNHKEFDLITPIPDHKRALELMKEALTDRENGLIKSLAELEGVGHRVVHGGEKYAESVIIDDDVIAAIEDNIDLAPLHNPPNLTGIRESMALLPDVMQVAVFDTAFHQTIEPETYLYGLPYEMYEKYRIRRYGFHGTSHRFVATRALHLAKRVPENTNVISCHLGNGASVTAIEGGKSVDTSMGFTPLEGLIMGTRCGDIDPYITCYLMEKGFTSKQLSTMMNKQSGLLGLSGISSDLRDLEKAVEEGNKRAEIALEAYANRIRKYIGAYAANLVKVDILVFTGGIGQNGVKMRERICHRLENLGMVMDYERNELDGSKEGIVSKIHSRTEIMVIPTNEELQIAIDTYHLLFGGEEILL